jgi:hypothetical protein
VSGGVRLTCRVRIRRCSGAKYHQRVGSMALAEVRFAGVSVRRVEDLSCEAGGPGVVQVVKDLLWDLLEGSFLVESRIR